MKKLYSVLLLGIIITTTQAAIPKKHCAQKCALSYNGDKYNYCKFICRYGDVIYVNEKRWISTKDCPNMTSASAKRAGFLPVCRKAVNIYLNYWK